jgi:hypothetical protein
MARQWHGAMRAMITMRVFAGGASETRTRDPLLAKQVLFQLSYSPQKTAGHKTSTRS